MIFTKAGIILRAEWDWNRQKRRRRRRPRLLKGSSPFDCYGRAWRTLALFPTEQRLRLTEHPLDSFSLFKIMLFSALLTDPETLPSAKAVVMSGFCLENVKAVEEISDWPSWSQTGAFPEERLLFHISQDLICPKMHECVNLTPYSMCSIQKWTEKAFVVSIQFLNLNVRKQN